MHQLESHCCATAGDRDVLAASAGSLAGSVLLGGKQRQLAAFRRATAHVKQDDVLLPTSTPREALAFTAALRLPGHSAAARQARAAAVQGMLAGMALTHCADTLVRTANSMFMLSLWYLSLAATGQPSWWCSKLAHSSMQVQC
jgi:hypothetical protein